MQQYSEKIALKSEIAQLKDAINKYTQKPQGVSKGISQNHHVICQKRKQ